MRMSFYYHRLIMLFSCLSYKICFYLIILFGYKSVRVQIGSGLIRFGSFRVRVYIGSIKIRVSSGSIRVMSDFGSIRVITVSDRFDFGSVQFRILGRNRFNSFSCRFGSFGSGYSVRVTFARCTCEFRSASALMPGCIPCAIC